MLVPGEAKREMGAHLLLLADGVDLHDSLMVREVEPEESGIRSHALRIADQLVARRARAIETAIFVGA